uniref:(salmon louse) hypothetical protein n=1 Tax=Lepeophtheirus salmonis TaxID=72036 RepID=A0A817FDA0_LEPSM
MKCFIIVALVLVGVTTSEVSKSSFLFEGSWLEMKDRRNGVVDKGPMTMECIQLTENGYKVTGIQPSGVPYNASITWRKEAKMPYKSSGAEMEFDAEALWFSSLNVPLKGKFVWLSTTELNLKVFPLLHERSDSVDGIPLDTNSHDNFNPSQNEMTDILGTELQRMIINEINAAGMLRISGDTTLDLSRYDQMTFVARYVKNMTPMERLLVSKEEIFDPLPNPKPTTPKPTFPCTTAPIEATKTPKPDTAAPTEATKTSKPDTAAPTEGTKLQNQRHQHLQNSDDPNDEEMDFDIPDSIINSEYLQILITSATKFFKVVHFDNIEKEDVGLAKSLNKRFEEGKSIFCFTFNFDVDEALHCIETIVKKLRMS